MNKKHKKQSKVTQKFKSKGHRLNDKEVKQAFGGQGMIEGNNYSGDDQYYIS